jgi:hypothetical protein
MFAAWGQVAALCLCGTEVRVAFLLVAAAAEPPVGVRVGKVGHAVVPHALRELDQRLLRVCGRRRFGPRRRAAGCHEGEGAEQSPGRSGRGQESPPAPSRVSVHR